MVTLNYRQTILLFTLIAECPHDKVKLFADDSVFYVYH